MRSENEQVLVDDLHWKEPRGEKIIFLTSAFSGEIMANDKAVITTSVVKMMGEESLSVGRGGDAAAGVLGSAVGCEGWGRAGGTAGCTGHRP